MGTKVSRLHQLNNVTDIVLLNNIMKVGEFHCRPSNRLEVVYGGI